MLMTDWFKTNRNWLIPGIIVTGIITLLFTFTQFLHQKKQQNAYGTMAVKPSEELPAVRARVGKKFEGRLEPKAPTPPPQAAVMAEAPPALKEQPAAKPVPPPPATVRPKAPPAPIQLSPDAVIQRLQGLGEGERKQQEDEIVGHPVAWTVYLFSAKKKGDDKFTVMFDSSQTGFGVVITAEFDLLTYLGLVSSRQGDRIRLAGTIEGLDISGTGQIAIHADSATPVQ